MAFDWFIDTVPEVIELVEQAEKRGETRGKLEGKVEGETRGELQALRRTVLQAVQMRFPVLIDFAQIQVNKFTTPAQLDGLALNCCMPG